MKSLACRCSSFTLFPELPSELRLKIWRTSLPGPRVVGIQYKIGYESGLDGKMIQAFAGWKSPDPVPIVLHACHESREEALKRFHLSFGTELHPARIYFNFWTDTVRFSNGPSDPFLTNPGWFKASPSDYLLNIFLGTHYIFRPENFSLMASDSEKIRYMIIDVDEGIYERPSFCWDDIRLFGGLRELTLLSWDEDERDGELMARFRTTLNTVSVNHLEWVIPKVSVLSAISGKGWGNVRLEGVEEPRS
jgi:hypothetical protein